MKLTPGWRSPLIAAGALAMLAGCAAIPQVPQTAAYRTGYADGCQSSRYEAGFPVQYAQDRARMTEADYARGWNDGHGLCYLEAEREMQRREGRSAS